MLFEEKKLVEILKEVGLISPNFTGAITLHFSRGGLSDIDRYEKSLKRSLTDNNKGSHRRVAEDAEISNFDPIDRR